MDALRHFSLSAEQGRLPMGERADKNVHLVTYPVEYYPNKNQTKHVISLRKKEKKTGLNKICKILLAIMA